MKRWFEGSMHKFHRSIYLLEEAEEVLDKVPGLNKLMDIVQVTEKGPDWVIRGFVKDSVPLEDAISNPIVAQVRQDAINLLSKEKGFIEKEILDKLKNNSANLHWSDDTEKIIIIDMQ
jgi:hypothetical protein